MTTQLLATELANLIHESKRKHNDLRQASEKSLEELKQIGNISEQAVPEALSQKINFVNPFIIACGTKNAKFTGIAIVCLQRLIVVRALPRSKLDQVLDALMQASSAGLDVQLKILQALPSLLQNYAADIRGDLLVTGLNICFILQSSKNAIVNNTSAATLQQLIVSVFDKAVEEDKDANDAPIAGEAPALEGTVKLRSAALDAYRVFNDLCLMTENQRPEFLRFSGLPQTFGLELIESVLTNHAAVFTTHPEQAQILRSRVMPLIMSALAEKPTFSKSVRLFRILYTILRRHINILPSECGRAIDLLTQLLDYDTSLWKRALCLEVFRGIFAEYALVRRIFALYDAKEGERDVLKNLAAAFVRLSTEKPAVIGLGTQSTMPATHVVNAANAPDDQAMLEASGVGIISASVGTESAHTGISTQWSYVRVPCIDQLDKTDPPPIPESYTYSLILSCLSSLSDGLAKFILPLTVPGESRSKRKTSKQDSVTAEGERPTSNAGLERSSSFKKNPVPLNPLTLLDHPLHADVEICASIIDQCWPAILATCSTFLYAALDSEYYHGLVRAFQRFAHVAGLLQLSTPRDAFLTTLGKAAVPPNVLTACLNQRPATPSAAVESPSSLLTNARNLLSVENLTTMPAADKRRGSSDAASVSLNTRNLLCLRALLNLGIALGPTLGGAWGIILETLQQADFVLFTTGKNHGRAGSMSRGQDSGNEADSNSLMANFSNEVRSVETAASRLIDSTIDFPNGPYVDVVQATCGLLNKQPTDKQESSSASQPSSLPGHSLKTSAGQHHRVPSFSAANPSGASTQEHHFALAKLGDIATINIERLLSYPPGVSGWTLVVEQLTKTLNSGVMSPPVRTRAAEILARLVLDAANAAASISEEQRGAVQLRILEALQGALAPLFDSERPESIMATATDIDIHRIVLEGLKSIIEDCGESLVSGWDVTFSIIGSVFVTRTIEPAERRGSSVNTTSITTRSSKLVRSSFNSLQLICSDFLATLPNSCFLILVDTLYKFCSQNDDLNIALTTVTFFWVLSDFLSGKKGSLDITADLMKGTDASDLERMAADRDIEGSQAALWMLLLLRLTTVTSDSRLELRNSAIQTLLRIFDAYGDRLSPEAWSICIKSVVFKLLSSLEGELKAVADDGDGVDDVHRSEWNETAVVILNGISNLLANYLDLLTAHPSFNHLWRELLGHLKTLLDFEVLTINTATFKALSHVLAQTNADGKPIFNAETVRSAWDLWSRGIPASKARTGKTEDNQECLIAYVSALREVYRLVQDDLDADRVQKMLTLLRRAVEEASIGAYVLDVEYLTPLQTQVLDAIQMIRSDVDAVPSALIYQISEFITLAYEQEPAQTSGPKRTYVAMSKASMKIVEKTILGHAGDADIYKSGAFSAGLSALCKPIGLKYNFPVATKSTQPWRLATSTVLTILGSTLPEIHQLDLPQNTVQEIWSVIVAIAGGIMSANCESAARGTDVVADEQFDIDSFHSLRGLIIPSLGQDVVPETTRKAYAEALFRTSIIHGPAPTDAAIINGGNKTDLSTLLQARKGRAMASPQTVRTKMAYVAVDELFSLVSREQATVVVQPPTPLITSFKSDAAAEAPAKKLIRIASTTAPFLILRCALTLRAYVSDQPLRGRMPQPLSQRTELILILRKLVELKSEGQAVPGLQSLTSETRNHLFRLYPLIIKALSVDQDGKVLGLLREALDVIGTELGV